jgi:general secretion pathway protein L
MSVLAVLIPPRPRPKTRDGDAPPVATAWAWVLSADGGTLRQGVGTPAEWPAADSTVAVVSPADIAWLQAPLPKAPAARLRQALLGVLEDQLLDDEDAIQFAVAPEATAGQPAWLAVLNRPWMRDWLQQFEAAGRPVDRVVPLLAPGATPTGHIGHPYDHQFDHQFDQQFGRPSEYQPETDRLRLDWSDPSGAMRLDLTGTLSRHLAATRPDAEWTASPAAASQAEAWRGGPVRVLGEAQRIQDALRSPWNLRQFDLAPRHRGATALRDGWRRALSPAWRTVHWGLAALVLINLVGLNAWAWSQQRALTARKQAMVDLLKTTHPQVRAVLDAPRQMARENEALRANAGQAGDGDLETLIGVAAAGWPEDEDPVASLQFEPGRLTLGVQGWDAERLAAFRDRVAPAGWAVTQDAQGLTLTRRAP